MPPTSPAITTLAVTTAIAPRQDQQVGAHLGRLRHQLIPLDRSPVEGEVDAGEDHEDERDHLDRERVEGGDRVELG